MFCHKCGKEIEDGSSFCYYCGAKMPKEEIMSEPLTSDKVVLQNDKTNEKKEGENRIRGKYMNSLLATIITYLVDFLALLLGSSLIAFIGVGGILVMLIEFYFLKAIHKAVYKTLTGKEWGTKTKKETDTIPQSNEGLMDNVQEKRVSDSESSAIVEPMKASIDYDVKEVEEICTDPLPSETNFIIIHKEDSPSVIPSNLQNTHSLHRNYTNYEGQNRNSSNFFTSVFPKIIHDVNINLGRSTVFCILAILTSVIICVCIITCHNTTQPSVSSEGTEITTPPSYENEEERWDAENCIYANFKYGIAFNLPKDMAWHKISGTAKHTVVKFVQPETQLTIFVNINPIEKVNPDKQTEDIWDVYEESVKMLSSIIQQKVNVNSAEEVTDYHYRKAEICGKHAIKTYYKSKFEDDRYNDKSQLTTIDYTFLYNHSITTVTIKCFDDVIDILQDNGITLDDFLKCFQLTPISEKYIRAFTKK